MSITHKTKAGDTFSSLSIQYFGSGIYESNIKESNPGTSEPISAGQDLVIPDIPNAPTDKVSAIGSDVLNECVLRIQGARFRYWNNLRINRSIDQMDIIDFEVPWDSSSKELRDFFAPFAYKDVTVEVGSEILFTGTIVSVVASLESSKRLNVSAYSKPGVLNDCTPSASSFPIEYNLMNLKDIASEICRPFGIAVKFDAPVGAAFDQVACESGTKALSFLIGLAKKRNVIISSTSEGALLFQQSVEGEKSVASLKQGASPLLSVNPSFNEQDFYSHITGIQPTTLGPKGSQFTIKNSRVKGFLRPFTFTVEDTDGVTIQEAVEAKAGRLYGNAVTYSVKLASWRDPDGNLWKPNTMINLEAPDAMIYKDYKFVIRRISFDKDDKQETASMSLVLPGSFSGKIPEEVPWA